MTGAGSVLAASLTWNRRIIWRQPQLLDQVFPGQVVRRLGVCQRLLQHPSKKVPLQDVMVRLVSIQRQTLHLPVDARLQQLQPSARRRRQTRQTKMVQHLLVHLLRLLPMKEHHLLRRLQHLLRGQQVVLPHDSKLLLLLHLVRRLHVGRLDDGVAGRGRQLVV